MKRYRIKPYDIVHDLWVLEERKWLFFWVCRGAGDRASVERQLQMQLNVDASQS